MQADDVALPAEFFHGQIDQPQFFFHKEVYLSVLLEIIFAAVEFLIALEKSVMPYSKIMAY